MVPNVTLCPPNTLAAIVTPVAFATKGGQRWHVAHLLQLTNEGSRMEREEWPCSYPSRIVFFVKSFKPASKLGRSFATVFNSRPNLFQ